MDHKFQYYPPNCFNLKEPHISETKLAKYIATEWIPDAPRSLYNGMEDMLLSILIPSRTKTCCKTKARYWCINEHLKHTDRQWKGYTSWLVGVAFSRHVMEMEGFQFWVPVSRLQGSGEVAAGNPGPLNQNLFKVTKREQIAECLPNTVKCKIEKSNKKPTANLPDYVAARIYLSNNRYEFAFFESKGGSTVDVTPPINNLSKYPNKPNWFVQSTNGQLSYNSRQLSTYNYLVATNVRPSEPTEEKRTITTRVWEHHCEPTTTMIVAPNSFLARQARQARQALTLFIAIHYAGVFQRLGLDSLASLLNDTIELMQKKYSNNLQSISQEFSGTSQEELYKLKSLVPLDRRDSPEQRLERYVLRTSINQKTYEISLSPYLGKILLALIESAELNPETSNYEQQVSTILGMLKEIQRLRNNNSPNFAIGLDGIMFTSYG